MLVECDGKNADGRTSAHLRKIGFRYRFIDIISGYSPFHVDKISFGCYNSTDDDLETSPSEN